MGFLDEVQKKAASVLGGIKGEHTGLVETIMGMVTSRESGGLSGLLNSFREKGLGGIVSSWVSTGRNLPISPDQVQNAIGEERIQQVAAKTGMSPEAVKAKLAELLPDVVDKLTPEGKVPEEETAATKK